MHANGRTFDSTGDETGAMTTGGGDDDDGSAAIFRAAYPALRRYAAVVAPADLDPDDLLQEAVARTLRSGPLQRLDDPTAYLRRAMTNLVANHNRTRGRERRALARVRPEAEAVPDYPSDLADLQRLDPLDRAAVFLADVERLPLAAVAAALDLSAVATRARVSRARRRLRNALATPATRPEPTESEPTTGASA